MLSILRSLILKTESLGYWKWIRTRAGLVYFSCPADSENFCGFFTSGILLSPAWCSHAVFVLLFIFNIYIYIGGFVMILFSAICFYFKKRYLF